jgi:bis(5'-nucleosidyl)-tetraphosphatase
MDSESTESKGSTVAPGAQPFEIIDRSYGIIPIRLLNPALPLSITNTQILLIRQKTSIPSQISFWAVPKGHAETGDASPMHSALRELLEETNLKVSENDVLWRGAKGETDDWVLKEVFYEPLKSGMKEVTFWAALVAVGEVTVQEAEVEEARWCTWEEALELATFKETKVSLKTTMDKLREEV